MSLSTFGAILGFAAEMVQASRDTYEVLVEKAKTSSIREALQSLLAEARKNLSLMEQTRRENVTEMILEPVAGLERKDYEIEVEAFGGSEDRHLLEVALSLEERERRFFWEASEKVPIPEVSRLFKKIAKTKEASIEAPRGMTCPV
ncbi:MAG: hypothetical protein N3G78_08225 [Desulfobacterota bacterium]|nr:hypothetical protein [Thermodesulfobacteriota bacterium]